MPFVVIVPPCPKCGNPATGRYVYYTGRYPENVISQHMKKGELIRTSQGLFAPRLYCENCGLEWNGEIQRKWLSRHNIRMRKSELGITKKSIADTLDVKYRNKEFRKRRGGKGVLAAAAARLAKSFYGATVGAVEDAVPKNKQKKNDELSR